MNGVIFFFLNPGSFLNLSYFISKHCIYKGYHKIHRQGEGILGGAHIKSEPWRNKEEIPDECAQQGRKQNRENIKKHGNKGYGNEKHISHYPVANNARKCEAYRAYYNYYKCSKNKLKCFFMTSHKPNARLSLAATMKQS